MKNLPNELWDSVAQYLASNRHGNAKKDLEALSLTSRLLNSICCRYLFASVVMSPRQSVPYSYLDIPDDDDNPRPQKLYSGDESVIVLLSKHMEHIQSFQLRGCEIAESGPRRHSALRPFVQSLPNYSSLRKLCLAYIRIESDVLEKLEDILTNEVSPPINTLCLYGVSYRVSGPPRTPKPHSQEYSRICSLELILYRDPPLSFFNIIFSPSLTSLVIKEDSPVMLEHMFDRLTSKPLPNLQIFGSYNINSKEAFWSFVRAHPTITRFTLDHGEIPDSNRVMPNLKSIKVGSLHSAHLLPGRPVTEIEVTSYSSPWADLRRDIPLSTANHLVKLIWNAPFVWYRNDRLQQNDLVEILRLQPHIEEISFLLVTLDGSFLRTIFNLKKLRYLNIRYIPSEKGRPTKSLCSALCNFLTRASKSSPNLMSIDWWWEVPIEFTRIGNEWACSAMQEQGGTWESDCSQSIAVKNFFANLSVM